MTVAVPSSVRLEDLRVGDVLAEGGEGLVHQVPRQPHLVYKSYRDRADRPYLEDLVAWPDSQREGRLAATVEAAAAWPKAVVTDADGRANGLLVARAPRRFSVRHRDGRSRLASLSYLTTDPEHRAVAYGLSLPPPAGPERIGLAYALARLLAAFEAGRPQVGHGDLSTKNVLWSLQRGPEVFVIDCDNCEHFGPDGQPLSPPGRRRAMTPNWDDPAVARGQNPSRATDRYSLALVFLRVVGAANFPVQARQRGGGPVEVRFPVPPGPSAAPLMDPSAPVWGLCARSLSLSGARPPAGAWLQPLEALLRGTGAEDVVTSVRATQGGYDPAEGWLDVADPAGPSPDDVTIIPVRAPRRGRAWSRELPVRGGARARVADQPASIGYRVGGSSTRPSGGAAPTWVRPTAHPAMAPGSPATGAAGPRVWPEVKAELRRFVGWWVAIHRTFLATLRSRARAPQWLRSFVLCAAVDFAMLVLGGAAVAVIVSPLVQS